MNSADGRQRKILHNILFAGFAIFTVAQLVDDTVIIGGHMEQIEYDFGLRYFFLAALINGSHMSMTTASMPLRCPAVSGLKVKNPGPEGQALTSPQRGGVGRQIPHGMVEKWNNGDQKRMMV